VRAKLIVVYTHTGQTAELVAKYRPPVPILTLVVPHLVNDGLKWKLEGRSFARQSLLCRGLMPFLAAPSPNGEALLEDAMRTATAMGLVKANDYVVVVQRVHEDFCIKIVEVADDQGIKRSTNSMSGMAEAF
jgi:pyruvate kinase